MKLEIDHPRTVRGPSWVAHSGGRQLAPTLTPSGRPFAPTVTYRASADLLTVCWGDRETYAENWHEPGGVSLLIAFACNDLLQGCKLFGLGLAVPIKGLPLPRRVYADPETLATDLLKFKRFCKYDQQADSLLVRWRPSRECVEVDDDQGGHPMKLIISADRQPEDADGQKPWLPVGVRIMRLSQAMPGRIVGR